jgi:iron complex outermembrane receptor protein
MTYSDFKFKDYKILSPTSEVTATYDGNALTGVAPWVINAGLDLELRNGLYGYINYYFNDKMQLNDRNTDFNPAYSLSNFKLGYRTKMLRVLELNVYGGIDNLFNEAYSSIVSLNAVGFGSAKPAYFNPSPGRNGFGGISIKYLIK